MEHVYDHETEATARSGRRIADWGGDDLFHHAPRKRFRGHAQPRSLAARRVAERAEQPVGELALAAHAPADAPIAPRRVSGPVALAPAPVVEEVVEPAPVPESTPDFEVRNGRKTVTITGRPGALAVAPRRRPARTVEERIGSRPDRVAAWAFGMGIGLILLAVSTADAAAL
jgi:hypothetical protein